METITYRDMKDLHLGDRVQVTRPKEVPMVGTINQKTSREDGTTLRILVDTPPLKSGVIFVVSGDEGSIIPYHETAVAEAMRKAMEKRS